MPVKRLALRVHIPEDLNSQGHPNYQGELCGIYVLPTFQHWGIRNILVHDVKEHLLKLNVHGMLVWVFTDNPNLSFYTLLVEP